MPFSSPFNISLWLKELEGDEDEEFLKDGLINCFPLNSTDAAYEPVEMENYRSSTDECVHDKVEQMIEEEIALGNYVVVRDRPVTVSALGAIPKPDSSNVRLIYDCSKPKGNGFNVYSQINYFKFQSLDDVLRLLFVQRFYPETFFKLWETITWPKFKD